MPKTEQYSPLPPWPRTDYCGAIRATDVGREVALWGLLHDASEAYLVDLPTPLKQDPRFSFYKEAERALMRAVCERFVLPWPEPEAVRMADGILLATEVRDLMHGEKSHWSKLEYEPHPDIDINPAGPFLTRFEFMKRFQELSP